MRRVFHFLIFILAILLIFSFFITSSTGFAAIGTRLYISNTTGPITTGGGGAHAERACDIYITLEETAQVSQNIVDGKKICYMIADTNVNGSIITDPIEEHVQVRFDELQNITFISDGVGVAHELSDGEKIYVTKTYGPDGEALIVISKKPYAERAHTPDIKVHVIELDGAKKIIASHELTLEELSAASFSPKAAYILVQFAGSEKWHLFSKPDDSRSLDFAAYEEYSDEVRVSAPDLTNVRVSLFSMVVAGLFFVQVFLKKEDPVLLQK